MQSLAERYLEQGMQQGIERGARANAIQNILAVLQTRFPERDTQSVEQIPTFEDFLELFKRS